jgi:disulfide bond formation protein DsbB
MKISIWTLVFLAWLIAAASTLGALFLGEVMGLVPCVLCWYQRVAMFPLVVVLAVGLLSLDAKVVRYALPFAIAGLLIAAYQLLLMAGFIPQGMAPCTEGVPCAKIQAQWFGFVTIPMLSFIAFLSINFLLALSCRRPRP